jgi:hypothetical protein
MLNHNRRYRQVSIRQINSVLVPGVRVAYVMESEDQLTTQTINVETDGRDSRFVDASLNLSGQFKMDFSGFASYQFYSGYDNYTKDGYTLGLRWDKLVLTIGFGSRTSRYKNKRTARGQGAVYVRRSLFRAVHGRTDKAQSG